MRGVAFSSRTWPTRKCEISPSRIGRSSSTALRVTLAFVISRSICCAQRGSGRSASLLLVREKAWRKGAIADCGTAITISPLRPRISRFSLTPKTAVLRPPMASKSMLLAAASSVNCAAATDATDAPNAFAKRSKNATAMRVSILENGRLPA